MIVVVIVYHKGFKKLQKLFTRDATDSDLAGYRITDILRGLRPDRRISGKRISGVPLVSKEN